MRGGEPLIWVLKTWRWLLLVGVVVWLLAFWQRDRVAQYRAGHTAATAEISAELAKAATEQAEKARAASVDYQAAKAAAEQKEKVRYVEVQKIIERPVYSNACFDADGLRIINSAIADGD